MSQSSAERHGRGHRKFWKRDSSKKTELEEQIQQLEEKLAQMQGKLKEAVERGRQKTSPEVETYERRVDDLRIRLNEKQEEQQQLSQV